MPPVIVDDEVVSSTLIKKCLKDGDIKKANTLLGRPYIFDGSVRKGRQIGRTISFPTANVMLKNESVALKCGVYASCVYFENKKYYGITNIGCAPTVRNTNVVITETHIMDFCEDIYNKNLTIELIDFIRDEKKFKDISELKEVIEDNIKTAVKILEDL
jgi:riboflavin kinase/FMN adenylyltransferase